MKQDDTTLNEQDILKQIVDQFGRQIFDKSESHRLEGLLSDYMTDDRALLKLFRLAVKEGVAHELLQCDVLDGAAKEIKINMLKHRLKEDNFLEESKACFVVDCFAYALGFITDMRDVNSGNLNSIWDEASIPIPRRPMVLFFVVDTSGSMAGSKIGTTNRVIHEILFELRDISEDCPTDQIKIAVLEFSSGAKWMYDKPIEVENFHWNDLQAGGDVSDFGEACKMLNQKLSHSQFLQSFAGMYVPEIILFSSGRPTDNYKKELDALKNNEWFEAAIKIAVMTGDDANREVLAEFTENRECVLKASSFSLHLKKMICFVEIDIVYRTIEETKDPSTVQDELQKFIDIPPDNIPDIDNTDLYW
jgi:uncharacterized protein YegL